MNRYYDNRTMDRLLSCLLTEIDGMYGNVTYSIQSSLLEKGTRFYYWCYKSVERN